MKIETKPPIHPQRSQKWVGHFQSNKRFTNGERKPQPECPKQPLAAPQVPLPHVAQEGKYGRYSNYGTIGYLAKDCEAP